MNRPRNFVRHCMAKITSAEDITASSVKPVDLVNGIFKVQGSSDTWYTVDFGHAKKVSSSCECIDWLKSRLLCKHFFAVFRHCPSWGFETILHSYRNRPYLTLDDEVICFSNTCEENITDNQETNTCSLEDNSTFAAAHQPVTATLPQSPDINDHNRCNVFARDCREVLTEAKNLTYLIQDAGILENFNKSLRQLVSEIKKQIPAVMEEYFSKAETERRRKDRSWV